MTFQVIKGHTPQIIWTCGHDEGELVALVNVLDPGANSNVQVDAIPVGGGAFQNEKSLLPHDFWESKEPKLSLSMADPDHREFKVVLIVRD